MWDAKRQFIWLAAGLALGTFVSYSDAHDEDGTFVPRFFFFMEASDENHAKDRVRRSSFEG